MDKKKIQKILVDSANKQIKGTLKEYCSKNYNSLEYYNYIEENLNNKVIEIPNPQIWVDDEYLTNSTTFSMLNLAKNPYTYCMQPCTYEIPINEPNFGENKMGTITDGIFYHRYLAECLRVFKDLEAYYPTHMVEVHDFSLALYVMWAKTSYVLLKRIEDHFKHFFTRGMINQFVTALTYRKAEEAPNIKFIMYDAVGLMTQCADIKLRHFKNRFKAEYSFVAAFTDKDYKDFILDLITPLRSIKALQKDNNYYNMEFREVTSFDNNIYHNLQGLMEGQKGSMNKTLYTAFEKLISGAPLKEVLKILKESVEESTYNSICNHLKENKNIEFNYKYDFNKKAVETMKKRGIVFSNYDYNLKLLPPSAVLSEVIINMDEFRKQYPSCTEQQFKEVYLMAQAINSCKRTFAKKYKRDNWSLCVKIISGEKEFEFPEVLEQLTTQLQSEQMDNFIARVE